MQNSLPIRIPIYQDPSEWIYIGGTESSSKIFFFKLKLEVVS